jgi:hypothetical protein
MSDFILPLKRTQTKDNSEQGVEGGRTYSKQQETADKCIKDSFRDRIPR